VTPSVFLETNVIYCGDNLARLGQFPSDSIDLIYLDPPFFSNRHYEVIWGDEAEIRSFEDRWSGGIRHYVGWMRERVIEMKRVLKPTGTIYLHCDYHASHYLKVMLDDVFGDGQFRNEIVWCYSGGGIPRKDYPRKHDTIFRYTKGSEWTFNVERKPFKENTQQVGQHSTYMAEEKRAIDLERGTPVTDWWTDINTVTGWSPERLGYPTQKPVSLLSRIIRASTNPGDIVLDPFCGCGTTLTAAQNLDRQWIGMDISPTACNVMRRQLAQIGLDINVRGLPETIEDLRALKPFEFQNWVIERINGTHAPRRSGDLGIDGWTFLTHEPVQVKQSEGIGRNVIDNFETAIERNEKRKGFVVAFSFGRGAHEEVARVKGKLGLEIELVSVQDLLDRTHPLAQEPTNIFGATLAPPAKREPETLPSVEELLVSDGVEPLLRAAEEPADYGESPDSN
jgi:DNA modification methylase